MLIPNAEICSGFLPTHVLILDLCFVRLVRSATFVDLAGLQSKWIGTLDRLVFSSPTL
ncbi:uncharacterized protein PHALS_06705 [Plasmopara halstedii]|uniref:RxLR-like protein n=1 Tax=Plasmopara halstedii TaxID=4781 RepID=A0A0P1B477_PLAHL|nr:uncharacterized protein PHALS_06705 [Plasmopara halstedii]CEG48912.1 hypothetical protein PHALS_06705 [Plasmopara halstedii]|eukprot:XP_024585281.1 hypothetical protein PHALS_06705 [Plasmopara halstedii]